MLRTRPCRPCGSLSHAHIRTALAGVHSTSLPGHPLAKVAALFTCRPSALSGRIGISINCGFQLSASTAMSISFTNRAVFGFPMCLFGNFPIAPVMVEREAGPNRRVKPQRADRELSFDGCWGGGGQISQTENHRGIREERNTPQENGGSESGNFQKYSYYNFKSVFSFEAI